MNIKERFLSKVRKKSSCWIWTASFRNKKAGYGSFKMEGKVVDAHRVSYMIFIGGIPNGMCVCHSCDNKKCVNPQHLWLGTRVDNNADMVKKGRHVYTDLKHGSVSSYKRRACLCSICRSTEARNGYLESCRRSNINYVPKRKNMVIVV